MPRILLVVAFVVCGAFNARAEDAKYVLNGDNTKVTFVGKKTDGKHEGGFKKLSGAVTMAPGDLTTLRGEIDIDTDSLYSDDKMLTGHLKSADFFDVKNHPKAKFKITKVEKMDKLYAITGDLTMNGKTKSISFPASLDAKDGVLTVSTTFPLDRTQWGMVYGKGKIEDKVDLTIKVNAKR